LRPHSSLAASLDKIFGWYIKHYGPDVNLFVDHSQIVQLECLRSGIWGTKSLWGRVVTYQPADARNKPQRDLGQPGSVGRQGEFEEAHGGVHPASGPAPADAKLQWAPAFGQVERGAAGYDDTGPSEIVAPTRSGD
jgi:(2R)-phospho-3-sulfolactate synthase (ComA)